MAPLARPKFHAHAVWPNEHPPAVLLSSPPTRSAATYHQGLHSDDAGNYRETQCYRKQIHASAIKEKVSNHYPLQLRK